MSCALQKQHGYGLVSVVENKLLVLNNVLFGSATIASKLEIQLCFKDMPPSFTSAKIQ